MSSDIHIGITYLFKGFGLLGRARILPFVVGPLLINVSLFYFGVSYLIDSYNNWLNGFLEFIPDWLGFIRWLLTPLFYLLVTVFVALTFTLAANFIGSPFYGFMAEKVELIYRDEASNNSFKFLSLVRSIPLALIRELQKLARYLLWAIPIIIVWIVSLFIPLLIPVTSVLWFVFGAWVLTVQHVDYAYDNNELSISSLASDLRKFKLTALSFGGITSLAMMIPVFNIFVIPAAVCGGTLFYVEKLRIDTNDA